MEYAQGGIGRVFVVRLAEGDELYPAIETVAEREGVRSAVVLCLGGMRSAGVVTGPKNPTGPIEPLVERFDDAREFLGVGTLHQAEGRPALHLHGAFGRGDRALVGCAREGASVFLVQEVTIIELVGFHAERVRDPQSGFHLLKLFGGKD